MFMEKIELQIQRRVHTKDEIALMYFPGCTPKVARRSLNHWFHKAPMLMGQLQELGCGITTRCYVYEQVKAIVGYFGEP